jgi:hypothetical protein
MHNDVHHRRRASKCVADVVCKCETKTRVEVCNDAMTRVNMSNDKAERWLWLTQIGLQLICCSLSSNVAAQRAALEMLHLLLQICWTNLSSISIAAQRAAIRDAAILAASLFLLLEQECSCFSSRKVAAKAAK